MKSVVCDICSTKADLSNIKEAESWMLGINEDFCPVCYEDVLAFVINSRKKYITRRRRENNKDKYISIVH